MKKRSRRKPAKPPPAPGASRLRTRRPGRQTLAKALPPGSSPREFQYKVVELSTVDEGSLERTLNEWVPRGWTLETVQFAMRESSKRPAMAFVFFTREVEPSAVERLPERAGPAQEKLRRLAGLSAVEAALAPAAPEQGPSPEAERAVQVAVEMAAAALFDVKPGEVERGGTGAAADPEPDEESGAVRWVELPEENDE